MSEYCDTCDEVLDWLHDNMDNRDDCVKCQLKAATAPLLADNAVLMKALEDIKHDLSRDETPQECLDTPDQFAAFEKRIQAAYETADKALQSVKGTPSPREVESEALSALQAKVTAYEAALNAIRATEPTKCPFDIYKIADDAVLHERYKDWAQWDGEYRKHWYMARTPDGKIYGCWPNAGKMVCVHKHKDVEFEDGDDIEVRECTIDEIKEMT